MNEELEEEKTTVRRSLASRGSISPLRAITVAPYDVHEMVTSWTEGENDYGCDVVRVWSASRGEERLWLVQYRWVAYQGYSASGVSERLLSYEEGLRLLAEHGKFDLP